MKIPVPSLPTRSKFDRYQIREKLEQIKEAIGYETKKGTDRRVAVAILEARPDLKAVVVDQVKAAVRLTLDRTMHDVLIQAQEDPQVIEYEYQITYEGEQIVITGDCGYRARASRPKNKKALERSIKREVALALQVLFEDRGVPVPQDFVNRVTDSVGREFARVFLDTRINEETIGTLSAPAGSPVPESKDASASVSKKPKK